MKKIRVLIVEDSKFYQELLFRGISKDPMIEVVAVASDPFEARDAIVEFRPDVMTLDIDLPRMDGIEFLRRLLPQYAIPVVMVSSLDGKVFDALAAGAVDFVCKPGINNSAEEIVNFVSQEICSKIKIASTAKLGDFKLRRSGKTFADKSLYEGRVIAIGASTGGTEAIFDVVKEFERDYPPVVIVQHMPAGFTAMYADRLNSSCRMTVKEAHNGDKLERGLILLANGAEHMRVVKRGADYFAECKPGEKVSGHCPSVDVLFDSVADSVGANAIGVILTGMGGDGARGLLKMRQNGAMTIGQDENSCVVYGMPRVAYDCGAVMYRLDLQDIPTKVFSLINTKPAKGGI